MANHRKFRKAIALLRKQGLLDPHEIDARKVTPETKYHGRKLKTIVEKYDDIVSGKAQAVSVTPTELRRYRGVYETSQKKLIVPKDLTETVRKTKAGNIEIIHKAGLRRVQIPVEFHNLEQYFRDIQKNHKLIDRLKNRDQYFGFKIFGNSSHLYSNIDLLLDDLRRYRSILEALARGPGRLRKQQLDVYRNIELISVPHSGKGWIFPTERKAKMSKEYNRKRAKRFRAKLKQAPEFIQEKYAAMDREKSKRYRERLKKSKSKLKAYREGAKKRAKKSRKLAKKKLAKKKASKKKASKKITRRKAK